MLNDLSIVVALSGPGLRAARLRNRSASTSGSSV